MNGDAAHTDAALTFALLVRLVLVARRLSTTYTRYWTLGSTEAKHLVEMSRLTAGLPSSTDGALAAEGRTAQADTGPALRCVKRLVRRPPQDRRPN
jgi:hypothetical protein